MSCVTFGIKMIADGTELVGAAKESTDAINKLGASAKVAQSEADKLNTTQNTLANTLNSTSQKAAVFGAQSNRLVDEYQQLTSHSDAWAIAQQRSLNEMNKSEAALARNAASVAAYKAKVAESALANSSSSAEITKLLDRYDTQGAKLRMLTGDFNKLMAAADAGGVGGKDEARLALAHAALKREMAATSGATTALGAANEKAAAAALGHAAATKVDTGAVHGNSTAVRESLVLMREASRGSFSRMAGSASILAGALGLLPALLNPVSLGIIAIVAAGVALAVVFNNAVAESTRINRALVLTSNYAGQTRDSMDAMAHGIASSTNLTIGAAKQVATEVAASGKISSGAYNEVTRLVGLYSDATGVSAEKSTAHIIKLFSDPAKGAIALNSTMHFLSDTEIQRIQTLQRTGDMVGAQTVLADAYTKKLNEQTNELGYLSSAAITAKKSVSGIFNAIMNRVGKSTTTQSLEIAKAELKVLQDKSSLYSNMIPEQVRLGEIAGHKATIAVLQKRLDDAHLKAVKDTTSAQQNQVDNAAAAAITAYESHARQLDITAKISQQLAYQHRLREQEKSLTGNALAAKEALVQSSIKLVAQLEKEKLAKKDPVTTAYNAALKQMVNLQNTAIGKTEGLTKAQTDLLNIMRAPGWAQFSAQQKATIVQYTATASVAEESATANKAYQATLDKLNKSGTTEISRLNKAIAAQKLHNAEIGKTPAQIELVKSAIANQAAVQADADAQYLDAAIAKLQADQSWVDANPKVLDIYKARASALHEIAREQSNLNALQKNGAVLAAQSAADKQQAAHWKSLWRTVERTGKTVFTNLLSNGKNTFESIGRAIKASVIDLLYQVTAKRWLISIGASISGTATANAATQAIGGASSGTGIGGWLSAGKSIYDGFMGSAGSGITAIGDALGVSAVSSFGSGVGLTMAQANAAAAAYSGAGMSSTGMAVQAGSAAGYAGSGMAGIAVGSMIAGDKKVVGLDGTTIAAIGAAVGSIWGPVGTFVGGAIGGIVDAAFGSGPKVSGTTTLAGNFSQAGFAGQYRTPWSQSGGWFSSGSSGVDTSALSSAQQTSLQTTVAGTKSVFDNLISASGDAQKSLTGWTFAINRQVASQAQQKQLVIDMANSMGSFLIPSLSALKKTGENLADTAVRLKDEFLATNVIAKLLGQNVSTAFGHVGLASLAARDNLVTLMGGLSGMNNTMQSYYKNFFTASERHANDLGNLTLQFAALGFTIPNTAAGFKALVSAQDLTTSSGQKTFASLMSLGGAFASVVGTADQAAAAAKQAAAAVLSAATSDYNTAKSNLMTSYQTETAAAQALATSMRGFATSFSALRTSLSQGNMSTLSPEQKYHQALTQFNDVSRRSKLGDPAALAQLESSSKALLTASQAYNASSSAYASDYARVQQALTFSGSVATRQVDIATQQVSMLQHQLTALGLINTSVLSLKDALLAYRQSATALNTAGGSATGGYTSYMSADIKAYAAANNLTTTQQIYDAAVAKNADPYAVGAAYGLSKSATDAALAFANVQRVAGFASGGIASSGMYMAGENGPELIHSTSATRIYPADQTSALMSKLSGGSDNKETNDLLKSVLVELRALVNQGGAVATETINRLVVVADKLDDTKRQLARAA